MPEKPSEELVRRRYLVTMRDVALDLWGKAGLDEVASALPEEVREATVTAPIVTQEWLPASYVMAWGVALWTTRAERQPKIFSQVVDRHTELGFGRVRRFFLSFATPEMMMAKASTLWRDDNSAGDLIVTSKGERHGTMELRNHVYTTTQLSRFIVTELIRAILVRCRAKNVTSRGSLGADGALVMHFAWT